MRRAIALTGQRVEVFGFSFHFINRCNLAQRFCRLLEFVSLALLHEDLWPGGDLQCENFANFLPCILSNTFSQRQLSRSLGVVRSTVERTLRRFTRAKLSWPLPPELSDAQLERLLYQRLARLGTAKSATRQNDAAAVIELARSGVMRQLLWREYRAVHSDGIGYRVYCQELAAYQACQETSAFFRCIRWRATNFSPG